MQRILLAANPEASQPWVAEAAAQLAHQMHAEVVVLAVDDLDMEALSTLPRSEFQERAEQAARAAVGRLAEAGITAGHEVRAGRALDQILAFADEHDVTMIVMGASTRGAVARRLLGSVPIAVLERANRPVLIVTEPGSA